MAALPLSERALREIECRLRKIREADDYHTDAGRQVFRARRSLDQVELPAVVIWSQAKEYRNDANGNKTSTDLRVDIEGFVPSDHESTGEAMEFIEADIKRALFSEPHSRLSDEAGGIGPMQMESSVSTARLDGGQGEIVRLSIKITYVEGIGNPSGKEPAHAANRF
jgi:hypothetical protein